MNKSYTSKSIRTHIDVHTVHDIISDPQIAENNFNDFLLGDRPFSLAKVSDRTGSTQEKCFARSTSKVQLGGFLCRVCSATQVGWIFQARSRSGPKSPQFPE